MTNSYFDRLCAYLRYLVFGLLFFAPLWSSATMADGGIRHVVCQFRFLLHPGNNAQHLRLWAPIPQTIAGCQTVRSIVFSPATHALTFDSGGNRYVCFDISPLHQGETLTITCDVDLYRADLSTAIAKGKPLLPEKDEILTAALVNEKFLETKADVIKAAAASLAGKDEVETLGNIMRYVSGAMRYSGFEAVSDHDRALDHGAVWALRERHGDCTEFSRLFVTLCRARGIPARVDEGYLTVPASSGDTNSHDWAEAYTRAYGWVRFDPLHVKVGLGTFTRLDNHYLCLSNCVNDPVMGGYHFYRYQGSGRELAEPAAVGVESSVSFWSPE